MAERAGVGNLLLEGVLVNDRERFQDAQKTRFGDPRPIFS
jgi:hypothetical protein